MLRKDRREAKNNQTKDRKVRIDIKIESMYCVECIIFYVHV